jgi:hypothetical protein
MTMYLPNRDVRATGSEIAEFLDAPGFGDDAPAMSCGQESVTNADDDGTTGLTQEPDGGRR